MHEKVMVTEQPFMKDQVRDIAMFQTIFEASVEGILVVGQDGSVLKANSACESMFGYNNGELKGKKVEDLIPKQFKKTHETHRAKYTKRPKARRMGRDLDLWGLKKDGSQFPLEISLSPTKINGKPMVIAFVVDITKKKLAELELHANVVKNRALLEAMPDMMFIHNHAGDFMDYYIPEQERTEQSKNDLIGKNIRDVVPPQVAKTILKAHKKAIVSKKMQIREYGIQGPKGMVDYEARTVPLNNHSLLTIVRDITAKKRVDKELSESEATNKAILQALPDLMVIHNKAGQVLDVQASNPSLLIFPKEEILGKNVKEILPKALSDKIIKALSKANKTKTMQIFETQVTGVNGTVDIEARMVPLQDNKLLAVLRDITKAKVVQKVLDTRNRALEAAGNGIIIADAQDSNLPIIYCNQAFSQITGYSKSEVIGKNCRFLQNDDRDQGEIAVIRKAIKQHRPCHVILRNYRKDKTLFWNDLTITPVFDDLGEITHFIGVQKDVTERKNAELLKDHIRDTLEMIVQHKPIEDIANAIVTAVEEHIKDCVATILLLDPKKGTLHKLAAPNLPKKMVRSIDGLAIKTNTCTCARAANYEKEVYTADISNDSLWQVKNKKNARKGQHSCWSFPILSSEKKVLGTFALYHRESKKQLNAYKGIVADLTQLASLAIEQNNVRKELEKSRWLIESYARELEETVEKRTNELKVTVKKLLETNVNLEDQVLVTKAAENRALASQAMFTAIAQNFPKGIIVVFNNDFEIVYIDGGELHRNGFDKNHFEGLHIDKVDVFSKNRIARIKADIQRTLNGEHLSFEMQFRDKSYTVNTSPLLGDNDQMKWTLFVYNDITRQKQAESDIRNALLREQELNELKSRFISMASHEFRTPLSAIHSSAILIGKQNDPGKEEKRLKYVEQIQSNVRNLVIILNDFLSLSKLEEGKVRAKPQHFELLQFATKLIDEIEPNKKPGQHILINSNRRAIEAYLDPKLLQHVLINLLSNAIKYSEEDTDILVELKGEKNSISVEVTDKGMGIPLEEQGSLFQRFFRAENSTNIQGTGLGLHIVKQYTELMGGTVSCKSKVGKGSTFTLKFPIEKK
jgi:PAS domain S-box-containing protein